MDPRTARVRGLECPDGQAGCAPVGTGPTGAAGETEGCGLEALVGADIDAAAKRTRGAVDIISRRRRVQALVDGG